MLSANFPLPRGFLQHVPITFDWYDEQTNFYKESLSLAVCCGFVDRLERGLPKDERMSPKTKQSPKGFSKLFLWPGLPSGTTQERWRPNSSRGNGLNYSRYAGKVGRKPACLAGSAQTLLDATPPIGKIRQIGKIAVTCEQMKVFKLPLIFRMP